MALAVLLWPEHANALPTPDTIIGTAQLAPVILGALGAGLAWLGRHIWRFLGGHKDSKRAFIKATAILGAAWVITSIALVMTWSKVQRQSDIINLATYLRCDLLLHENRYQEQSRREHAGLFPRVSVGEEMKTLNKRLTDDASYDPILVSVMRTRMVYDAGFLGAGPEGRRRYFEFVRLHELRAYLERIPAAERANRDVVLEMGNNFQEDEAEGLIDLLHEFRDVRVIERRASRRNLEYGPLFAIGADGKAHPAARTPDSDKTWTVRPEFLYLVEEPVRFPNMTTLLDAEEARKHAFGTPAIMPYGATQMSESVAAEFGVAIFSLRLPPESRKIDAIQPKNRARLIAELRKVNVFLLDVNSPSYDADLKNVADEIGSRPYLLVPLNNMQWLYGLDVPRSMHHLAAASGRESHFLGSTLQMPEAMAQVMMDQATNSGSGSLKATIGHGIEVVLDRGVAKIGALGVVLFLLGFGIRLVCLPLMVGARRVKIVERLLKESKRSHLAKLETAKKHLRLGGLYATPGALANLLFLVPFFTFPVGRLANERFAWINDLGKPDAVVAVLLGLLFGAVATLMYPAKTTQKAVTTFAIASIGLGGLAFFTVASGIGLYACGGLVITVAAEVLARRGAAKSVRALELEHATPSTEPLGECVPLAEAARVQEEVGGKAAALGTLSSLVSPLFKVPEGVVFRNFKALHMDDAERFDRLVREKLSKTLPGAESMKFAVRSTAPGEDGTEKSQAGRYVSVLEVPFEEVPKALRTVLESYGQAAIDKDYRVGVLVQRMAPADYAGVLFTRSPKNASVMHIEFIEGLGDRLVSGESAATEILVGRDSGVTRPADPEKALMLESLYLSGLAIERLFGRPMDCEWAFNKAEKQLYLLQARPVTATEHEEAIVAEQTTHLATVPATADWAAARWRRSDVREVVDNPSGLAVSMLQETYSKAGAIGIAGERLGLHFDDTPIIRLFGQLYEPTASVSLGAIRTQLGVWRLKRRVLASGDDLVRRMKEDCAKAPPKMTFDGTTASDLAKQIVDLFDVFVRDVYPTAFETTLLAKLATPATDIPKVHTIAADMFADLVKLASSGDPKPFVARWGHRSQSDYDLAVASFGEDVEGLVEYASGFRGMTLSKDDDHGETTVYGELVKLKEVAKDRAVKFLRQGRAPLLRLADLLGVDRQKIFMLPLSSIRAVALGKRGSEEIAAEIAAIAKHEDAWKTVTLPDEVSPADIEFLGGEIAATANDGSSWTGKFVATNKEFSGEIVHAGAIDENHDLSGGVLVVEALQPTVVKYFGRVTAIVSQTGAYLSHAAIVAREAGVPVVVLPKALSLLPHASRIKVSSEGAVSLMQR